MMTPNAIEILIHCHCTPTQHPRKDAPAVAEELIRLEKNGLIKAEGAGYRTTERGMAHIEQLCMTPWPRQAWIASDGSVLKVAE